MGLTDRIRAAVLPGRVEQEFEAWLDRNRDQRAPLPGDIVEGNGTYLGRPVPRAESARLRAGGQ